MRGTPCRPPRCAAADPRIAAYGRIEAARASRSYPVILDLLIEGALTLTAVGLLRQHLTLENHRDVLEPYAAGGEATVENIQIRCKRHNVHEAELFFGAREPPMVRESRAAFWT